MGDNVAVIDPVVPVADRPLAPPRRMPRAQLAIRWARRRDPARWVLGAMVTVWSAVFITLGWIRHARFGTFAFDLGIYDQGLWLLSRFEMFDTVKGLPLFGHHMNLVLVLLAPFYRLGAGPEFLLVVQVLAQASGAVAVFLLARDRLGDRWLAVVLAGVLLANPTYQFLVWEFFHPDALAIAPLLFAYWAARAERWGWFALVRQRRRRNARRAARRRAHRRDQLALDLPRQRPDRRRRVRGGDRLVPAGHQSADARLPRRPPPVLRLLLQ